METIKGTSNRYLDVNLSAGSWKVHDVSTEDLAAFLGGKGLALKIYYDRFGEDGLGNVEPLGADNPLIFSMGVMLGTGAPCSARFEVVTRSPLTGLMVGSSCGGPFGEACKSAGWDGVIISGRSDRPVTLRIDRDGASFEDAEKLWGMGTHEVQDALKLGPKEGAAVIGPAGENLVGYANICSGHRFAGRGGVGAVMGSKNLKAVVARGKEVHYEPVRPEAFARTVKKARKFILRNPSTKGYRAFGTNVNVRPGIKSGFVPVHNFRDRWHPDTEKISGEAMAERYTTRHSTCRHCSVLCGHKGHYPDGEMRQIPEYETTGMFGGNIGNFNPDLIGEWNQQMNHLGLDTISAGGTIAWAMEAGEKGLRETSLRFGESANISSVLDDIAFRRGEGDELAEGSRHLSGLYGGSDFAIQVKGLEIAAYDPRAAWGHGLSYAVYNKGGCHLGSYLIGLELLEKLIPPHVTAGKAEWVVFMEDIYTGINSLQTCQFTTFGILSEPPIPRFLPKFMLRMVTPLMPRVAQSLMDWSLLSRYFRDITGIPMNKWGFLKAGERITKLERHMNILMGSRPEDDTLPGRFLKEMDTPYPGKNTVVPLDGMVRRYRKIRKYGADGGPSSSDLAALMPGSHFRRNTDRTAARGNVRPSRRPFKTIYVAIVMAVLGWFIPVVACRKKSVREEVKAFREDFRFRLAVWPAGPSVAFRRDGDRLRRIRPSETGHLHLDVHLKSIDAAWLLFSFQESTCASEATGRLMAEGDLPDVCTFIRLMDKVEILLLPKPIAKLAVKEWEAVK